MILGRKFVLSFRWFLREYLMVGGRIRQDQLVQLEEQKDLTCCGLPAESKRARSSAENTAPVLLHSPVKISD